MLLSKVNNQSLKPIYPTHPMSRQIGVHGIAAISDSLNPVTIDFVGDPTAGVAHSQLKPPASVPAEKFPYFGRVHFLFQSPPTGYTLGFDITELHVNGHGRLASLEQVDLFNGESHVWTLNRTGLERGDTMTSITQNVFETPVTAPDGLCVTYTVNFVAPTSSFRFCSVSIKYK
jgi:hypothetical protein